LEVWSHIHLCRIDKHELSNSHLHRPTKVRSPMKQRTGPMKHYHRLSRSCPSLSQLKATKNSKIETTKSDNRQVHRLSRSPATPVLYSQFPSTDSSIANTASLSLSHQKQGAHLTQGHCFPIFRSHIYRPFEGPRCSLIQNPRFDPCAPLSANQKRALSSPDYGEAPL
jgi:hypothetical protein